MLSWTDWNFNVMTGSFTVEYSRKFMMGSITGYGLQFRSLHWEYWKDQQNTLGTDWNFNVVTGSFTEYGLQFQLFYEEYWNYDRRYYWNFNVMTGSFTGYGLFHQQYWNFNGILSELIEIHSIPSKLYTLID